MHSEYLNTNSSFQNYVELQRSKKFQNIYQGLMILRILDEIVKKGLRGKLIDETIDNKRNRRKQTNYHDLPK